MTKAAMASWALFLCGVFAGGVLDHALLALEGSETTPYGIRVGVAGNLAFMLLNAAIAVCFFLLHRSWKSPANLP